MEKLIKKLQNPSMEYRPLPFWSWNDKLDPEMLRWQIREMHKMGHGGYFMHARGGLQTDYLSEDWMECIDASIDEGNKLGMNSWCYDEEGWPSGFAGGVVTAMGDNYHVRWLEIEETNVAPEDKDSILGIYKLDIASKKLSKVDSIQLEDGSIFYIVRNRSNPYYIDILNPKVIKKFIEVTHEKYYEKFKEHFGKGMPGFFTDEPQFGRGQIPWSYILPEEFKKRWGYDLIEYLPALFIPCDDSEKVRYHFWTVVNELYVNSFGKQIYDWCEEHNCKLTGHVMMEDSIFAQMMATGGGMPFYEFMHIPGMDWLGRVISSPLIPKQVSSVASQLGKKQVLSETFALCGWDVSWEELKWIAEWQYVNGVSLLCQHLEGYTLRGLRKRDYPPSMFYQQTWWEEYKQFNDYFSRLGMLLTDGEGVVNVLILHPMKSGWIAYDHTNNELMQKLDKDLVDTSETLSGLHIDYHYGDETILAKHAAVNGNKITVGKCSYSVVILPSTINIDKATLNTLDTFRENGGIVISYGLSPYLCEGAKDEKLNSFVSSLMKITDRDELSNQLAKFRTISIKNDRNTEIAEIHYQERKLDCGHIFYLVNHNQENTYDTIITLHNEGKPQLYEAESGELKDLSYSTSQDGKTLIDLTFLPMQSYIIVTSQKESSENNCESKLLANTNGGKINSISIELPNKLDITNCDFNSMTLDSCSYRINGGEWQGPIYTIQLMNGLLSLRQEFEIELKFNFESKIDALDCQQLFVVVEKADEFEIAVNGKNIKYNDNGWWKDSEFKKVNIHQYLITGTNEIILKRRFYQSPKVYEVLFGENVLETEINKLTYDVELESIYLLGDFGVFSKSEYTSGERKALFNEGPFYIGKMPNSVDKGELTQQGFCFFAGKMTLTGSVQIDNFKESKVVLCIGKPDVPVSNVYVNGQKVKTLPWAPYDVDITEYVIVGNNLLAVELLAGNRNLLGPHHHISGESYFVGPSTFSDKPGWADAGMTNIWRDSYCFVRFGLK